MFLKCCLFFIVIFIIVGIGLEVINIVILFDLIVQMKKGIVSFCLLFDVVIVVLEMIKICLQFIIVVSGIDVFVYVFEVYISVNVSLIIDVLVEKVFKFIFNLLFYVYNNGENLFVCEDMVIGSLMVGFVFGNVGVGVVYVLVYLLGGWFYLLYGMSNVVMLFYVLKVNVLFC